MARALSLPAALLAHLAGAAHISQPATSPPPHPTAQPATRGQDEQDCGWLDLPEDVFLSPKISDGFTKGGDIETADGGVQASWTQDLFAWNYQTVYFYSGGIDAKLFAKAEVIEDEEVQLLGVAVQKRPNMTTIVFRDCNDVVLYIVRETKKAPYNFEIYNRDDQLVSKSKHGEKFTDQIHFFDQSDAPLAIAQSPTIVQGNPKELPDQAHESFGNIPAWEVKYVDGHPNNSTLGIEHNRWVIVLTVQEHAVRTAERAPNGNMMQPGVFGVFLTLTALFFCVAACSVCGLFFWIYRLVYPKRYEEVENKYLQDNRRMYGSLATRWEPPAQI